MKRILLFVATNLAVMLTASIVLSLLGIGGYRTAAGLDYGALAVFCVVWGSAGSFISLLMSRWMAKMATGATIVDGHTGDPRADRVYALVPIEGAERRDGRRTYVHVDGLSEPVVASRSERAILVDVETALAEAAGLPRRRRVAVTGQETLLP